MAGVTLLAYPTFSKIAHDQYCSGILKARSVLFTGLHKSLLFTGAHQREAQFHWLNWFGQVCNDWFWAILENYLFLDDRLDPVLHLDLHLLGP